MSDANESVNEFLEALRLATQPTGKRFDWGRDPASDPDVIRFRELHSEALHFKKWSQENPVRLANPEALRDSIGEELNRAIAQAPNLAGPAQKQLYAGAFAVIDINSPDEYDAFRKKHWQYAKRSEVLQKVTAEMAEERQQMLTSIAQRIQAGDGVPGIATVLPAITTMLKGPGMNEPPLDSADQPVIAERDWRLALFFVPIIARLAYAAWEKAEEMIGYTRKKQAKQIHDSITAHQAKNRNRIEERSNDSEAAMLETTNADLLLERDAYLEQERTKMGVMERALELTDQANDYPIVEDPELEDEIIRRGARELKQRIDNRQLQQVEAAYPSLASVMLDGQFMEIVGYLGNLNLAGERMRRELAAAAKTRDQKMLQGWSDLKYPNVLEEDAKLWF